MLPQYKFFEAATESRGQYKSATEWINFYAESGWKVQQITQASQGTVGILMVLDTDS